jgi:type IV secretory pathway ATPase VirB11/archaellum biosynthesis ATPase
MESLRQRLVRGVFERGETASECECETTFDDERLCVDASDCRHDGQLEASEHCRATVVDELAERDAESIHVTDAGIERVYDDQAAALLVAAGRFLEAVRVHDDRLATRVRRDPLAVAREATGRADTVADVAAETGLAEIAEAATDYERALGPLAGLSVSDWRVETTTPAESRLVERRDLDTGSTARIYALPEGRDRYVLAPAGHGLDSAETRVLAAAYDRLAEGHVTGGDRAAGRAVRAVLDDGIVDPDEEVSVQRVAAVLNKHTRGHGVLADFFADPRVSDVFVTAPAPETPLSVRVEDRRLPTNVRLTEPGVDALASRYRRESGRGFSRADPTLDAATTIGERRVRVAGVTAPASEGVGFAFRAHDRDVWTLPALVDNGTLSASAAALCSLAVERGSAVLVAGPRGAGKTTLLGALLWELPPAVRTVVIEDTPELPVGALQGQNRDVQALCAADDETFTPAQALRTALRLGEGALAIGEVRGEEAQVLYEAMRIGANDDAVLGTIHGDDGEDVFERVVSDLGVPASSFGVTDLLVTTERTADGDRRVRRIEEVVDGESGQFATLYGRDGNSLAASDRIDRGNSQVVAGLTAPAESYADLRERLAERTEQLESMSNAGKTGPAAVDADVLERQR